MRDCTECQDAWAKICYSCAEAYERMAVIEARNELLKDGAEITLRITPKDGRWFVKDLEFEFEASGEKMPEALNAWAKEAHNVWASRFNPLVVLAPVVKKPRSQVRASDIPRGMSIDDVADDSDPNDD